MGFPQATTILKTTKHLLLCPVCEEKGKKEILGELDEDGSLIVRRFRGDGISGKTKVISQSFQVICGVCNEIVFYRKEINRE